MLPLILLRIISILSMFLNWTLTMNVYGSYVSFLYLHGIIYLNYECRIPFTLFNINILSFSKLYSNQYQLVPSISFWDAINYEYIWVRTQCSHRISLGFTPQSKNAYLIWKMLGTEATKLYSISIIFMIPYWTPMNIYGSVDSYW